jgi:TolB-like protein
MIRRLILCFVLAIACSRAVWAEAPAEPEPPTSLAITPFASSVRGEDEWLGKAIADLLARKLAVTSEFALLERTRLQSFLDELELQDAGFVGDQDAERLGRVSRVEQVIYGNFSRSGSDLTINLVLVDLETQSVLQRHTVDGTTVDLQEAVTHLARGLLEDQGRSLSDTEEQHFTYRSTDSASALKRFYEGFDQVDRGHIEDAFGSFYAAADRDREYHEARLWMGLMLQQWGQGELAAIAFQEVVDQADGQVEGHDAKIFLAGLLEDSEPDRAAELYRHLIELGPKAPHSLEAAHRLAGLLERSGDTRGAYDALAVIDSYAKQVEERPESFIAERVQEQRARGPTVGEFLQFARQFVGLESDQNGTETPGFVYLDGQGLRHSQFFAWDHALGLYREAIVRMALLYPNMMREAGEASAAPLPPRGTFLVTPETPTITETSYGETEPLFLETVDHTGVWKERLYAVVAPQGTVITGAELRVTGRLLKSSSDHSFAMRLFPMPMPANYHNAWIAALYGQTRNVSTLEKYVPFHGKTYSHLLLQLTENHSEIFDWDLRLTLKPAEQDPWVPDPSGRMATDPEGRVLGHVSNGGRAHFGPSEPQYLYLTRPRRSLAIVDDGRDGLTLIAARGSVGNEPTELWMSRSADGREWTRPAPLPTNSVSEDYAPQLLRAEDGSLRLFWLSDRRGRGWEVWTSSLPQGGASDWTSAVRVPLDRFSPTLRSAPALSLAESPHYAAVQDRRGRWILAFHHQPEGRIFSLVSRNGIDWEQAGEGIATAPLVGLSIAEGSDGVVTMVGVNQTGGLVSWRSNDLREWVRRDAPPEQLFRPRYGFNYAGYLFAEPGGQLLALLSDSIYGLQFARFDPTRQDPVRDLVPGITLEAFAATPAAGGGYLVASEEGEDIAVRHYHLNDKAAKGYWPLATPLYTSTGEDSHGNRWSRTIAGARVIVPDVTAVATQSDGRVWWGIETGVFSLHNGTMLFSDGSMGYPFHTTTEIEPCGEKVIFASRYSRQPRITVGRIASLLGMDLLKTEEVPLETDGRITQLACAGDGSLIVGTSTGEVLILDPGGTSFTRHRTEGSEGVSALAGDPKDGSVLVGTDGGKVYRVSGGLAPLPPLGAGDHVVQALTVSPSGRLWAAVEDAGLFQFAETGWREVPSVAQAFPRFSVGAIETDLNGGVWLLPDSEAVSAGVAHYSDGEVTVLNPPQGPLATPVDMAVDANGAIWIGTSNDGLYRLEVMN